MMRTLLNAKIHRATVTSADLNYVGSITIDGKLLEAANILPFEKVQVVSVTTGHRWETYAIVGEPGSGDIQVNGGGARLVCPGDVLIIMTYAQVNEPIPASFAPRVVMVDGKNRITEVLNLSPKGMAAPDSAAGESWREKCAAYLDPQSSPWHPAPDTMSAD
jgi:aspartate 1-decarboxylase